MPYLATNVFNADGVKTYWDFAFAGVSPDSESGTTPYLYAADVKAIELYRDIDGNAAAAERIVTIDPGLPLRANIVGLPVAAGRQIKIYRQTEIRFPLVDYRDRQTVSEFDLDLANRQAIFVAQETQDAASNNMALDKNDNYDAQNRRIVKLAPGVDGTDAVNMDQLGHSIRIPKTEPVTAELPVAVDRANKILSFDSLGNPQVRFPAEGSATDLEMRLAMPTGGAMVGYGATTVAAALDALAEFDFLAQTALDETYLTYGAVSLTGSGTLVQRADRVYRARLPATFPVVLTGVWGTDSAVLVEVLALSSRVQLAAEGGAELVGLNFADAGALSTTVGTFLGRRGAVLVSNYLTPNQLAQAQAGTVVDLTVPIAAAFTDALARLPCAVFFDSGTYRCNQASLPNLAKSGLEIRGTSMKGTIWQFTGAGIGLNLDAFASGSPSDPFAQGLDIHRITLKGSATVTELLRVQGLARCHWSEVNLLEVESTDGTALSCRGLMLSKLDRIIVSTDFNPMTSKPRRGLRLDEGRRAGVSVGNSSNNIWTGCYFEGMPIGGDLVLADQNVFIGGSMESCSVYGLIVGVNSRYNSFIGVGFENLGANGDVADAGIWSQYTNCYSSQAFIIQGRGTRVSGGFFERVDVQAGSDATYVGHININHWATGSGGFFDNGHGTQYGPMYDSDLAAFVYPKKDRFAVTFTTSPLIYSNTTGVYVEFLLQTGTITQVRQSNGTGVGMVDPWQRPSGHGAHLMRPGDRLEVSFSGTPTAVILPHNFM